MLLTALLPAAAQRRATPVQNQATQTQAVNETASDTSRINAKRRAQSISYVDDRGLVIYVDTLTNMEWTDSTLLKKVPKMEYPLLYRLTVGVDVWDAAMRAFGQDYGLGGVMAELNMHNRYLAVLEAGMGQCSHRGLKDSYSYRTPAAFYFRLGMNYNFLYNSNPAYMFTAGLRYGFSPFSFTVSDVTTHDSYWDETGHFNIPSQHMTAGWIEFSLGLRVKLWGPISAGWSIKYHSLLHESKSPYGQAWYIPGYGSRNGAVTGSFMVTYTLDFKRSKKPELPEAESVPEAESAPEPTPDESSEQAQDLTYL